ncbi:bifunctional NADH-specific enoyl-ACP reductase/trans-2-enoyl-CoA reductase, partial [Clostridium perfringens]
RDDVQAEVAKLGDELDSENIYRLSDLEGFRREFFQLFGFEVDGVDYEQETDPVVEVLNVK